MGFGHNLKQEVLSYANAQVGVTEATGANDGTPYYCYMKPWGYGRVPWCALFVKTCLAAADVNTAGINAQAVSAVSQYQTRSAAPAVVWWKPRVGGTGHVGLIESWPTLGQYFWSIEGNTGNAVKRLKRKKSLVQKMSNWVGEDLPSSKPLEKALPKKPPDQAAPAPRAPSAPGRDINRPLRWLAIGLMFIFLVKKNGNT